MSLWSNIKIRNIWNIWHLWRQRRVSAALRLLLFIRSSLTSSDGEYSSVQAQSCVHCLECCIVFIEFMFLWGCSMGRSHTIRNGRGYIAKRGGGVIGGATWWTGGGVTCQSWNVCHTFVLLMSLVLHQFTHFTEDKWTVYSGTEDIWTDHTETEGINGVVILGQRR